MRRTRAELRAEVLKAGRGAGLPLGVAEDLAMATAWMTAAAVLDIVEKLETAGGRAALCGVVSDLDHGRPVQGAAASALAQARHHTGQAAAGLDVSESLWARLSALAALTYVPESDQSRASGAGAGDIDND